MRVPEMLARGLRRFRLFDGEERWKERSRDLCKEPSLSEPLREREKLLERSREPTGLWPRLLRSVSAVRDFLAEDGRLLAGLLRIGLDAIGLARPDLLRASRELERLKDEENEILLLAVLISVSSCLILARALRSFCFKPSISFWSWSKMS
mmetsp:Transcript_39388/g.44839  ORF Transcript_39388/g.44839 Transcript_39388/m.44839 type:complete len:151 (-) Transcript_39388:27-479(-)